MIHGAFKLKRFSQKNELCEYVNGTNVIPAEGTGDGAAITKDDSLKQDQKAKADLVLSVQSSKLKQIREWETSGEVWLNLESLYMHQKVRQGNQHN